MRLLAFLLAAALLFWLFIWSPKSKSPVPEPARAVASPGSPDHSNLLKRPLDRTHEALDANRKRTSEDF